MARVQFNQLQFYDKYVAKTLRRLPDKFVELCHMHLSLLLDLSGDKLELLLSGHKQHNKKNKRPGLSCTGMFKKKDKRKGLFGLPLTDEGVCFMMPLIEFLKMETNVAKEGLFRKPGNVRRMATLKELLTVHGPTFSIDPKVFSAHDVACVLKEFIRELPEPLLTGRHLEAHRRILALGENAKTAEEIYCFSSRKLSALQLLMLLLPSPAQKLTMHLVQLLQRVAGSPESKMTSATLSTIFAPILFIERKVQPTDLHNQITTTAPAVSFMIDKAHELFQPPKQLVMDLARIWKSMRQSFLHSENIDYDQMQKSLSGQTNVYYTDSKLSKCDDDTSNTQAEVTNQLEVVQVFSAKSKRFFDAPEFCAGLCRRSMSIGSSIRKRLSSLRGFRSRESDVLRSRAALSSSCSDCKTDDDDNDDGTATSTRTRPFEWRSHTSEARHSLQLPKPGLTCCYASENCPTAVFSSSSNSPVKMQCQKTATCSVTLTVVGNQKRRSGRPLTGLSLIVAKSKVSGRHIDRPDCFQSESSNDYLPHVTTKKITMAVTASKHSNPVTNTCQQPSRKPKTRAMSHATTRLTQDGILETAV